MDPRVKPEDDVVGGETLPAIMDRHPGRNASGDPGTARSQSLGKEPSIAAASGGASGSRLDGRDDSSRKTSQSRVPA